MVYIKGLIGTLIVAGLLMFGWNYYSSQNDTQKMPERYNIIDRLETQGMIDFTLPRLDGSNFNLESQKGKVVILNFWATWCEPCVREYPSMVKLADNFNGDLIFIAVSADEDKKDIDVFLKAFGKPKAHTFMLWDPKREVADKYGVERLPETFVFHKNGKLIRKVIGEEEWFDPRAVAYFESLIKEDLSAANAQEPKNSSKN